MNTDTELLRQYAEEGSESAFTNLVNEHLNLVYSAALRETQGDSGLAEDLAQAVFTDLARKARRLLEHPCLAGWLYTTVRRHAANIRRADLHRKRREEEVQHMQAALAEPSPEEAWQQIRPVLDDALHELKESDRQVLVLRFLEDRTLSEIGARLGLAENTARMRAERALDKLRGLLARRGVTSTTASLALALTAGVVTPAPAAWASTVAASALSGAAVSSSSTVAFLKIMSISKIKAGVISAILLAGTALPVWQQTRINQAQAEIRRLQSVEAPTAAQPTPEESHRPNLNAAERAELDRLRDWQAKTQPELLRLRGMAGVARRSNLEADNLRAQVKKLTTDASGSAGGAMTDLMKTAMEQQVLGRLARMKSTLHLSPEQEQAAHTILMRQAGMMSAGMKQVFSGKFDKGELEKLGKAGGNPENQIQALLTPEQKAAYGEYQAEEAAYNARLMANSELIQLKSTLGLSSEQEDGAFAALYETTLAQINAGANTDKPANPTEQMQWNLEQKAKALEPVLTVAQLENYRQQQAQQAKLIKEIMDKMQASGGAK